MTTYAEDYPLSGAIMCFLHGVIGIRHPLPGFLMDKFESWRLFQRDLDGYLEYMLPRGGDPMSYPNYINYLMVLVRGGSEARWYGTMTWDSLQTSLKIRAGHL